MPWRNKYGELFPSLFMTKIPIDILKSVLLLAYRFHFFKLNREQSQQILHRLDIIHKNCPSGMSFDEFYSFTDWIRSRRFRFILLPAWDEIHRGDFWMIVFYWFKILIRMTGRVRYR